MQFACKNSENPTIIQEISIFYRNNWYFYPIWRLGNLHDTDNKRLVYNKRAEINEMMIIRIMDIVYAFLLFGIIKKWAREICP